MKESAALKNLQSSDLSSKDTSSSSAEVYELANTLIAAVKPLVNGGVVIALSGGVDSTVVACACLKAYEELTSENSKQDSLQSYAPVAITFANPFTPQPERIHAERVGAELAIKHVMLPLNELDPRLMNNPVDRCYTCKKDLFSRAQKWAQEHAYKWVLDGSNADDSLVYRPGIKALKELGICSPLAQANFTKQQVRALASYWELSVAERPSAPCMATRFPYNSPIRLDLIEPLAQAEHELLSAGVSPVRLRVHNDILRIEVSEKDISWVLQHSNDLVDLGERLGFAHTCLDLACYQSGSMDKAAGLIT